MAMTIQEIRDNIAAMTSKDEEIREIYEFLVRQNGWELLTIFDKLILIQELKERMKDDVVHFVFTKKDGSERQAYGTRLREIIGNHNADPKGSSQNTRPSGTFSYFDIERQAWRCFKVDSLTGIDRGYTI